MVERLPDFIDPLSLVKKQADLRGRIPLAAMPRVRESVSALDGEAEVELHFRREGRVPTVSGRVAATLTLQCQSCMEPLLLPVESEVHLGVVATLEQADALPETLEPLLMGEASSIPLLDIVEDELLLALPIIPRHEQCSAKAQPEPQGDGKKNPFGVLAVLKHSS